MNTVNQDHFGISILQLKWILSLLKNCICSYTNLWGFFFSIHGCW